MKKKLQAWFLIFLAGIYLATIFLVQVLNYFIKGTFDVSAVLGTLTGAFVLSIINIIINQFKKN
jgi:hypothetical protein